MTADLIILLSRWTWTTSIEASLLSLLVVLIVWVCGRWLSPRWRYLLGLLVLLRLLLPVGIPSPWSLQNLFPAHRNPAPTEAPAAIHVDPSPVSAIPASMLTPEPPPRRPNPGPALLAFPRAGNWLAGIWLVGVALSLLETFARLAAFCRRVGRGHLVATGPAAVLLEEEKRVMGIRTSIRLWAVPALGTPALYGFWRPRLLIPDDLQERLHPSELRLVFLHELAHLKSSDVLLNWVIVLVGALHWFNPVVWFTLRRLRADREMVRDAQVLGLLQLPERSVYGHTLLKLASAFSGSTPCPNFLPVIQSKTETKKRIIMITRFRTDSRASLVGLALVAALLMATTFTRASRLQAADPTDRENSIATSPDPAPAATPAARSPAGLGILWKEIQANDRKLAEAMARLDELRKTQGKREGGARAALDNLEVDTVRRLETEQIIAQSRLVELEMLFERLKTMTRTDLRKSILIAVPAERELPFLLERKAEAEQNRARLTTEFTPEHPQIKSLDSVLKEIDRQVDDRLEGVLLGLKVNVESCRARLEAITDQARSARKKLELNPENTGNHGAPDEALAELANLLRVQQTTILRLLQEQADASTPHPTQVVP